MQSAWEALPARYPGVDVDEFVVMPNHVHGILVLMGDDVGATPCGCPVDAKTDVGATTGGRPMTPRGRPMTENGQAPVPAPTRAVDDRPPLSLPDVVHRFKSFTTARYRHGVKNHGWTPFPGRLWQRNDYEHIVRNDDQVRRIRQYIADNPAKWALDPENPARG